ncbi:MAG TPA: invasin domain 3-containing protein, partial [Gemmatimonadales bacterium]|nr:invasin domain 3-containing protein [Gemmatimonadales bacterium]
KQQLQLQALMAAEFRSQAFERSRQVEAEAESKAATRRFLGSEPGTYTTRAVATPLPDEEVFFTATAVAATLSMVVQPSASAAVDQPFERQPVLQLLDQSGQPLAEAGVMVTATIATGGGELRGTTSVASDASGVVTFTDLSIRGSPGTRTLIFAARNFASTTSGPVALGVGAAASIEAVEGGGQSATVNTAVAVAPAVVVRDVDGNGVPGVPVAFTVTGGGGSVAGGATVTGSDGIARAGSWTLGTATGENTLRARVNGADLTGNPVTFSATATAGAASTARSTITAEPASITTSGGSSASTITVTARDQFDNPVPGVAVTLAASGSDNTLTQPSGPTGADGTASGTLSATSVGERTVSATIDGRQIDATATVSVGGGAPSASRSSASVGNGTAGSATAITVHLADQFGNPVAGEGDDITVQITGANPSTGGAAQEEGGGTYTVRYTPTVAGVDQITVRVNGTPTPDSPLSSTVSPSSASAATTTAEVPTSWRVFSQPGEIPVRVTVRDAHGNVRAGLSDQVTVQVDTFAPFDAANNGDGTYSASFAPPRFGAVPVVIRVNGEEISGSPFVVNITFF